MKSISFLFGLLLIKQIVCDNEVEKSFKKHEIITDQLTEAPKSLLKVEYANGAIVNLGAELTPKQAKLAPVKVSWTGDENSLYTLIFSDLDAPSRKQPEFREIIHWLLINIPLNKIEQGKIVYNYTGPWPPKNSGLHRYVHLVFKQPANLKNDKNFLNFKPEAVNSKAMNYSQMFKLGVPIAGNFFQCQWHKE
ncbi:protein D3-like protein [Leptotrombidium deliense]|uniref:Protein D3-like protein n=1 Tax=Leptotrombidium deliense TaxID=299467 RepID=A0A443SAZ7_9ACAR|nr:protein D3-like protein [Leptotrombidium deliense]